MTTFHQEKHEYGKELIYIDIYMYIHTHISSNFRRGQKYL